MSHIAALATAAHEDSSSKNFPGEVDLEGFELQLDEMRAHKATLDAILGDSSAKDPSG
ncbi:Uu.00g128780.m01.CDS01 [Anthostomella pinea]|uniref:Uu.00g128780.m01.CDS01 n=1 Tax=Anthostomella pinea TaxID=933095 RepID=A0AAI8VJH4_9PEZI|nr:Uu.00g128780.m01.CDS01 [Anthostomella pinea]